MWDTIDKHIAISKACPYSKRWWTHKLTEEKRTTTRLGRWAKTFQSCPSHPIHEQYQNQRNKYAELLRKTKTTHQDKWLKELNNPSIWQASKFIATPPMDAAKLHILTLQIKDPVTKQTKKEVISNKDKGDLLLETFFPTANPNLPQPDTAYRYPPPRWTFSNITDKQITRAISKLKPHKATRRGTLPNSFLKNTKHLLVPFIGLLFRATQHLDYYPPDWALTETLALKKPGKPDYSSPSVW